MDEAWDCPNCGAHNEEWRHWCRSCTTTVDAARPPVAGAQAFGGYAAGAASTAVLTRQVPSLPQSPPRRKRRWPTVVGIVVIGFVLCGTAAVLFLRQIDPKAAKDLDALRRSLPPEELFGQNYIASNVRADARTRAGAKLDSSAPTGPGCDDYNSLNVAHLNAEAGEDVADGIDHTASVVVYNAAYDTEDNAVAAFGMMSGDGFRQCAARAASDTSTPDVSVTFNSDVSSLPAPSVGDQATAFAFTATYSEAAGSADLPIEVVVFRVGRTVSLELGISPPGQLAQSQLDTATTFVAGQLTAIK